MCHHRREGVPRRAHRQIDVLGTGLSDLRQRGPRSFLITIDGLRWQEFFGGADRDYFKRDAKGSGGEPERRFWRDTPEERRAAHLALAERHSTFFPLGECKESGRIR